MLLTLEIALGLMRDMTLQNGEQWKCADAMKEVGKRKLEHRADEDVDASLVSCMRLEVLLTPALRNSSWRK